jgi:hypothetical protein
MLSLYSTELDLLWFMWIGVVHMFQHWPGMSGENHPISNRILGDYVFVYVTGEEYGLWNKTKMQKENIVK